MAIACEICGKKEILPYKCKFCGSTFCSEHRLPEHHYCPGLDRLKTLTRDSQQIIYQPVQEPVNRSTGFFNRRSSSPYAVPISRNYSLYIIVVCILVFFLQIIPYFTQFFVLIPQLVVQRPWTIITSMFLHANLSHLFFNMMVLFFFGPILEKKINSINFLIVYFGAGIFACIGHMVVSSSPVLGASGAIYGIFACLAIIMPQLRVFVLIFPMKIIHALALFAFFDIVMYGSGDMIAHAAHLSGLLFGIFMGYRFKNVKHKQIW
ncbi:MAG: rhomboid family intramembrane serine protease [Methanosarcinales archaeon]|nr:rhomboid family intramembrane serine protease [Methanosarcinales archaeon]